METLSDNRSFSNMMDSGLATQSSSFFGTLGCISSGHLDCSYSSFSGLKPDLLLGVGFIPPVPFLKFYDLGGMERAIASED